MSNKVKLIIVIISILIVVFIGNGYRDTILKLNKDIEVLSQANEDKLDEINVQNERLRTLENDIISLNEQLVGPTEKDDNFITENFTITRDHLNYGDRWFDLLYNLSNNKKVYYQLNEYGMVEYDDGVYMLRDFTLQSHITSRPRLSPNKKKLVFMAPLEDDLNTSVYLFDIATKDLNKIVYSSYYTNESVKQVRWLDDENLILIIGSTEEKWSRENNIYHYNLVNEKLTFLEGFIDDYKEISDFIFRKDGIEYEIWNWNKDFSEFDTEIGMISYEAIEGYKSNTVETNMPNNTIDILQENLTVVRKDFDELTLENELYQLPHDFITSFHSTVSSINFPYATSDHAIYDLEHERFVLDIKTIEEALSKVWGKSVAKEGYLWYLNVHLKPQHLNFISAYDYHPDTNEIVFTVESFLADVMDSLIGSYNVYTKEIQFIKNPFYGSVSTITAMEGTDYAAYSYYTGGDEPEGYVTIIDLRNMKTVKKYSLNDLYDTKYIWDSKLIWSNNTLTVLSKTEQNNIIEEKESILWKK